RDGGGRRRPRGGMEGRARIGEQAAVVLEVEAVVAVAAVERALARDDDARRAQLAQVVGDEWLRLAQRRHELTDAAIAPGELVQQQPADRVPGELEDLGWLPRLPDALGRAGKLHQMGFVSCPR